MKLTEGTVKRLKKLKISYEIDGEFIRFSKPPPKGFIMGFEGKYTYNKEVLQ